jgi:hypothetical protein
VRLTEIKPDFQEAYRNRVVLALKLFNLNQCQIDLELWKNKFPDDPGISEMEALYIAALSFEDSRSLSRKETQSAIRYLYLNKGQ